MDFNLGDFRRGQTKIKGFNIFIYNIFIICMKFQVSLFSEHLKDICHKYLVHVEGILHGRYWRKKVLNLQRNTFLEVGSPVEIS